MAELAMMELTSLFDGQKLRAPAMVFAGAAAFAFAVRRVRRELSMRAAIGMPQPTQELLLALAAMLGICAVGRGALAAAG